MSEAPKQAPVHRLTIKDVRIAYAPGIFIARAGKDAGPDAPKKYGAAFLFPPTHPCVKELGEVVVKVAQGKWGAKADEMLKMLKAGDRLPVHSGDAKATSAGYAGNLFLNAGNTIRPTVVDGNRAPLTQNDGKPYSGCYVNAIIEIWAQDNQYGKRVNASLLGVQFVRDGERLAGGSVATADDFEPLPSAEGGASNTDAGSLFN
jgi:hypothetical protein